MGTDSLGKQLGMPRITIITIRGKEVDMDVDEAKALYCELHSIFIVQPQQHQLLGGLGSLPLPHWQNISTSGGSANKEKYKERHQNERTD